VVKPPASFRFYLGSHRPYWLWTPDLPLPNVPLFVSRATIGDRKTMYEWAFRKWALDSGAFMEILTYGRWTVSARAYADECLRYADEVGLMEFCAIQDWMCEDGIIKGGTVGKMHAVGTRLSVLEHQKRTVASYVELMAMEPEIPWLPVLQGYTDDDYLRCVEMYRAAGVDLSNTLVGVGSVCRREASDEIACVLSEIVAAGVPYLHGFGVKTGGLEKSIRHLRSADSMAWSFGARAAKIKTAQCVRENAPHRVCNNCPRYAAQWYWETIKPAIDKGMRCATTH